MTGPEPTEQPTDDWTGPTLPLYPDAWSTAWLAHEEYTHATTPTEGAP